MTDADTGTVTEESRVTAQPPENSGLVDAVEGSPGASKQRSVSFNRDVHVKRIAPSRPSAPSNQGPGVEAVRRQPLAGLSRHQLAAEAAKVLAQASQARCSSSPAPDKFFSLPYRKKHKPVASNHPPIRRRSEELGVTTESLKDTPLSKTNEKSSSISKSTGDVSANRAKRPQKNSLLNLFKRPDSQSIVDTPKRSNISVKRSKSDVTDLKSGTGIIQRPIRKRTGSESEEYLNSVAGKKTQLSPIIEINNQEDYFKAKSPRSSDPNVEKVVLEVGDRSYLNISQNQQHFSSYPPTSLEYKINPVEKPPRTIEPRPPARPKRAKTQTPRDDKFKRAKESIQVFGTLPKSRSDRNKKLLVDEIDRSNIKDIEEAKRSIKETISSLENKAKGERSHPDMIHSSQKPQEKLPLTKGQAVDNMVKFLNKDKFSPPPKASLLTSPAAAAHNNNQPFSYTKPSISPDPNLYVRSLSPDRPPSPINKMNQDHGQGIIYAQVVCGNGENGTRKGGSKQTVHTAVNPAKMRHAHHSDEDEGLGYEESRIQSSRYHNEFSYSGQKIGDDPYRHLEDYVTEKDSPITPRFKKYRTPDYIDKDLDYADEYPRHEDREDRFIDKEGARGRGDGMDSRRRQSLAEHDDLRLDKKKAELSFRRDLLESRINARKHRDQTSPGELDSRYTPEKEYIEDANPVEATKKYVSETSTRYYRDGDTASGFTDKYTSESHKNKDGTIRKTELRSKSKYNPDTSLFEPVGDLEIDRREFIDRRLAEEPSAAKYFPQKQSRYFPPEPEYEPPSLDSQTSGARYSPDERKFTKQKPTRNHTSSHEALHSTTRYNTKHKQEKFSSSRDRYSSNPEIAQKRADGFNNSGTEYDPERPETFHNSLRRQKYGEKAHRTDYLEQSSSRSLRQQDSDGKRDLGYGGETSGPESSRSRYDNDRDRDNKFADSGIENDYRKDSNGDIHSRGIASSSKVYKSERVDARNESEDEGFASSLLIASERQHTEDNSSPVKSTPRHYSEYRHDHSEYKRSGNGRREDFVHRERSIDDGSFFDPRLDKFEEKNFGLNKTDAKPPKASKKISGLEKVKQLFSRDSSKKSKKEKDKRGEEALLAREEELRRRYTEYRGPGNGSRRPEDEESALDFDYSQRRRLATPSPSPATLRKDQQTPTTGSWFKSLDRLSKKKTKNPKIEKESVLTTTEEESSMTPKRHAQLGAKPPREKNLRFFGDTDLESAHGSVSKHKSTIKSRSTIMQDSRGNDNRSGTLNRSNKTLSSSVHGLDRTDKTEPKHRSSSLTNLEKSSQGLDSRQNLLANSYNKEKYNGNGRDLHNISEIHSNSETESQFEESARRESSANDREYKEDAKTSLKKPPMSPMKDKRRSRSYSNPKVTKSTLTRNGYSHESSRADSRGDDSRISSSELQHSRQDLRSSRQELTGSRNELRSRRRRVPPAGAASPAESSTEGDSSHNSQKSVVYLHAATVGDIPGRGRVSRGKSRDDVSSINSSHLQPQSKTVSRSFSVLAPWKPRHYREGFDINYSQSQASGTAKRQEKPPPPKNVQPPKKESSFVFGKSKSASTKNLAPQPPRYDARSSEERSIQNRNGNSTLTRRPNGNGRIMTNSNGTLYKKSESKTRGSSREHLDEKIATRSSRNDLRESRPYKKSQSTEVLSADLPNKGTKRSSVERERLSRSISMPKDPNKSAGWFKITKKSKKTESTNRIY